MDLVQLRTFAAVAEEQHLTRAAERLHISQSAASVHIRAVEETRGVGPMLMREEYALQGERDGVLAVSPIAQVEQPLFLVASAGCGKDPLIRAVLEATRTVWPGMAPVATPSAMPALPPVLTR